MSNIPSDANIQAQKARLRKAAKARLQQWPRKLISSQVCHTLAQWSVFKSAKAILAYFPLADEPDISPLFLQFPNKDWHLPYCQPNHVMTFHKVTPESSLTANSWHILEPQPDWPLWDSSEKNTLMLIPGLMFDQRGYRLGRGQGYYDRWLAQRPAVITVGIAPATHYCDELPTDNFDQPMKILISEQGIRLTS